MTPRTGRPKKDEIERKKQDSFMITDSERNIIEQAIAQEHSKESVRQWIVRKAVELAKHIIGQ